MSPLSSSVLVGGALLASPALYQSLVDGTLPLDVALTRLLVALVACWLALTVLTEFILPRPEPAKPDPAAQADDPPAPPDAALDPIFDAPATEVADVVHTVASEHVLEGPAA